jgi:hypothetical protein
MPTHTEIATPQEESERAPCSASPYHVVASPGSCPICLTPLRGRQKCCSGKCRATLSRRRRIPVPVEEVRALRGLVTTTLESLWEVKAKLDNYVGG